MSGGSLIATPKSLAATNALKIKGLWCPLPCLHTVRRIRRNISAFSPEDPEDIVRHKLVEPKVVPAELRTDYVRYRLRLTK